ncbi:transposase domain-containing protein, partial [Vibrio anguillarum]|nr:transposase domain-containing protein [Vibrio anguillarum]MBF4308153.1 transposase domain-containing protein [Vibrio anguillarum]MBF4317765.1 transposase domain-containing protein [Vibrio anguillarum]MBF4333116.1 transposase domain-containing protein [Vibrio anguillarum]
DASALLYSIIETAKANGLILYDYMVKLCDS